MSIVIYPHVSQSSKKSVLRIYSAEDLEGHSIKGRYELIRGELYKMPNNSAQHGFRTSRLTGRVITFVEDHSLGYTFAAETRFTIESHPDTVLAPDFAFVAKDRISDLPETGYLRLTPDLVLETRSPSDGRREFAQKISQWLSAGAKVVWALDPKPKTLTVHKTGQNPLVLTEEDTLTCEELLPQFNLSLAHLFAKV